MASIPFKATATGDIEDAPAGAIPIDLYGVGGSEAEVPTFTEITGSVSGVTGSNLQAILDAIAGRLAALETPEG